MMTQTEYDEAIQGMSSYSVDLAYKACTLHRQNDPSAFQIEEKLLMLRNIIKALRDYDITTDYLTEAQINDYFEYATHLIESCPM